MKILDCTLRDGGYYTNWDFPDELLSVYLKAMNESPVDYVEIGYRAKPEPGYLGRFYYCPNYLVERIHKELKKGIVVIIDEKNCLPTDVDTLLTPVADKIAMVRITVAPNKIDEGLALASVIKSLGLKVAFNLMYISKIRSNPAIIESLKKVTNDGVDILYLVDSYGGILPQELASIIEQVKKGTDVPLGFHGHNNMELALANTITAIESGVTYVDATITGMGRGAGNLKTELFLTYLSSQGYEVDFNVLSKAVAAFEQLRAQYGWGTNLPYMVSGAYSLPQKDVMDWTTKQYYSYNGILQALMNQKEGVNDNVKLPFFARNADVSRCLVIGGGNSVKQHLDAIKRYLQSDEPTVLIFSSSKHAALFMDEPYEKMFCIQGKEADRLEDSIAENSKGKLQLIYSPFPRKMGTQVPGRFKGVAVELQQWQIAKDDEDSHLKLALETALQYNATEVIVVGFDGYNSEPSSVEYEVAKENDQLFKKFRKNGVRVVSLTPTRYKNLDMISLYSLIK